MKSKLELDPERVYVAIERGVCSAFDRLITGPAQPPCRDVCEVIGDAVERAMTKAMTAGERGAAAPVATDTKWNEIEDL